MPLQRAADGASAAGMLLRMDLRGQSEHRFKNGKVGETLRALSVLSVPYYKGKYGWYRRRSLVPLSWGNFFVPEEYIDVRAVVCWFFSPSQAGESQKINA